MSADQQQQQPPLVDLNSVGELAGIGSSVTPDALIIIVTCSPTDQKRILTRTFLDDVQAELFARSMLDQVAAARRMKRPQILRPGGIDG